MDDETWLIERPQTIVVEGTERLSASIVSGSVDIVAHDEPDVVVEVHSISGPPLRVQRIGSELRIRHERSENPEASQGFFQALATGLGGLNLRVELGIMVPRHTVVEVAAVNANVLISGIHGGTQISTVNGDLVLDSLTGDLDFNTVNGQTLIRAHRGAIAGNSVNGGITANGVISSFTLHAVGAEVNLDTTAQIEGIFVNTVNGSLTARVPAELDLAYTVTSMHGKLQIDGADIPRPSWGAPRVGRTGGGGPVCTVEFNTVNGGARLIHAAGGPSGT